MEVLAWSQNLTPERADEYGARHVSEDELFSRSDVVSIHVRLSDCTRGLVTSRHLEMLGPQGYLVNTSRGPIVVEPDLVHALNTGVIAGAGIDTFDVEPLPPEQPLRTTQRGFPTPHIGYVTRESYAQCYAQTRRGRRRLARRIAHAGHRLSARPVAPGSCLEPVCRHQTRVAARSRCICLTRMRTSAKRRCGRGRQ